MNEQQRKELAFAWEQGFREGQEHGRRSEQCSAANLDEYDHPHRPENPYGDPQ
jgi:hypothetical protein